MCFPWVSFSIWTHQNTVKDMAILLHQFRYLSFTWIKCLCQPCFLKQVQTKPISNLLNPSTTPQTEPLRRSPRKKILYQPCLLEMKFHIISLSSSPYPLTLLQDQSQPTCQGPPQEKQTLLVNSHHWLTPLFSLPICQWTTMVSPM